MTKLVLKVIVPNSPMFSRDGVDRLGARDEITFSALVNEEWRKTLNIPKLVFAIENTLNEHLPSVRVHADIVEVGDEPLL